MHRTYPGNVQGKDIKTQKWYKRKTLWIPNNQQQTFIRKVYLEMSNVLISTAVLGISIQSVKRSRQKLLKQKKIPFKRKEMSYVDLQEEPNSKID